MVAKKQLRKKRVSGEGWKKDAAIMLARGLISGLIASAGHHASNRYQLSQNNADFLKYHGDEVPYQPINGSGRKRRH